MPAALFGTAIFIGRGVGALLTPYIGYLSDKSQHKWGRRLPFMFWAVVPLVITFFVMWLPPNNYESLVNLAYLVIISILFRIALGFYYIPYQSLLPEIAQSDGERAKVSAIQSVFLLLGMLIGGLAGLIIDSKGFVASASVYALIAFLFLVAPLIFVREPKTRQVSLRDHTGFWSNLKIALENKVFRFFVLVWAIYLMTTTVVQSSAPFIVTEICLLQESDTVLFYIPGVLASLLWFPVVSKLVQRFGKTKVYSTSLLGSAIIFPGTFLIGSWLPLSLKGQCISWAVAQAVAIAGIVVLTSTFIAEITDLDEAQTGQRREGVYFGMMNVVEQISSGLALLFLPLIFLLGRSQAAPMGPLGIRLTGVFAGVCMFIAYILFVKYQNERAKIQTDNPNNANSLR